MNEALDQKTEPRADTKDRILDAAERLFAEQGFEAASLRQITSEAGVNLAAINYHFQSKEQLLQAVVMRKARPVNRRRLEMLDQLEADFPAGPLPLEGVLQALLEPFLRASDSPHFGKLVSRLYVETPDIKRNVMLPVFQEVIDRFRPAIVRALPGSNLNDVALGMHFGMGATIQFLAGGGMLEALSGGRISSLETDLISPRLIRFVAAGLRALAQQEITA
jgi:AcrR family transcriptional regulator